MSKQKADITYTDSRGNVWDLMVDEISEMPEGRKYAGRITSANFHTYQWQKEATEKRFGEELRAWKKDAKTFEVVSIFQGDESLRAVALNSFHDALEYDIKNFEPGHLRWEDYTIDVYGIEVTTEPSDEFINTTANKIVFYAPNPVWYKINDTFHFDSRNAAIKLAFIRTYGSEFLSTWLSETEEGPPLTPTDGVIYIIKTEGKYRGCGFRWFFDHYEIISEDWVKDYEVDLVTNLQGYDYAPAEYDSFDEIVTAYARSNVRTYTHEWLSLTRNGPALTPVENVLYRTSDGLGDIKGYQWDGAQYVSVGEGYDYMYEAAASYSLYNSDVLGSKFIMKIYGPIKHPLVSIINSQNKDLRVTISFPNTEVPNDGYLTIDSLNKEAYVTDREGQVTNVFGSRDPDYYLWDYIPGGLNIIQWDGTFIFDVTIYEERSEPKWLTV